MPDPIDPDLLSGTPEALDAFYRRHRPAVLRWVIRLGGPLLDPEDVAQDVFSVAFRRIGTLRPGTSEQAWLYGVARRVVANARRRAAFRRVIGLHTLAPVPDPGPGVEEEVELLWRRRRIHEALEELDARKREVLVLMDLEQHTAPEVARLLGIAVGTVYSRLHHARKQFRVALERSAPELRASVSRASLERS